jgi:O-antigen ligase
MIGRMVSRLPTSFLGSAQFWLTASVLSLAPLFFGSVDQLSAALWTVLLSLAVLCGLGKALSRRQVQILILFFVLCGAYAFVALLQVLPDFVGWDLNDPIWRRLDELLRLQVAPRISSRAEIPSSAVAHFLLFVTSFVCGFFAGTSRRNTDRLLVAARYSILVYAVYGLLSLALTPDMLLWAPRTAYRGGVTATFVNHNTAATYIGVGVILWFCSASADLPSLQRASFRYILLAPSSETLAFKSLSHIAAGVTCFFALLLTGSRGGLICSCIGLLVALSLLFVNRMKPALRYTLVALPLGLVLMGIWLSQAGRIGSAGAFDDARWLVYRLCAQAILERPWLGTGAGSFPDIFPALRTDELASWGVWEYAHSTILEIALEMGIPIAITVILGAVASVTVLIRAALKSADRKQILPFAVTGILVLSYLHSLIDFSLQIPGYFIVFAILLGCALSRASADSERSFASPSGKNV